MKSQMAYLKQECEVFADLSKKVTDDLEKGGLEEKGKAAREAKKSGVKECYEFTYGKITSGKEVGVAKTGCACCTVF